MNATIDIDTVITIDNLIFQYGSFTDRLNNPESEYKALALCFYLDEQTRQVPTHRLTAFTSDAELRSLASVLSEVSQKSGEVLKPEDALAALKSTQTQFQLHDDDWGALSPYLEELVAAEHPNVRLKTPGKYNAEGRHKVLLRTQPGEGGWKPAAVIPSRDAEKMWRAAGLDYPKNLKGDTDDQLAAHADRYEKESLSYAVSRRRRLRKKVHDIQLELEALTPAIRKDNLEDIQRRLPEIVQTYRQTENTGDALKAQKRLIEVCLSGISNDQEVDPHDPEFQTFSRALNGIERDMGRFDDTESVKNDEARIAQAAAITRSLISSLPNDGIGASLQETLRVHLDHVIPQ